MQHKRSKKNASSDNLQHHQRIFGCSENLQIYCLMVGSSLNETDGTA